MEKTFVLLEVLGALAAGVSAAALLLLTLQVYRKLVALPAIDRLAAGDRGVGGGDTALAGRAGSQLRRSLIACLASLNDRWVPSGHLDRLRNPLRRAGHPRELSPAQLAAAMEIAGALFALAGVVAWVALGVSPLAVPLAAVCGAGYPLLWLRDKARARGHAISRALPFALDLLTLSVEAGLDFPAALGKVVEKGRKGPLADELGLALRELHLGKTREEALRGLAARLELASVTGFVSALVQADKMGTPLGKVLRILSTQMRVERTQRAEKLANEAPVKMLAPLIGCIFPTIFLMLFGPIAYQMFYGGQ